MQLNQPLQLFWLGEESLPQQLVHTPFGQRLVSTDSLTQRIQQDCPTSFRLQCLSEGYAQPMVQEAALLNLSQDSTCWIRQVQLCCGNNVKIIARTLVSQQSSPSLLQPLQQLGQQPLGEWLFSQPKQLLQRQYAQSLGAKADKNATKDHQAWWNLGEIMGQNPWNANQDQDSHHPIWIRRSLFEIHHQYLLVQEAFIEDPYRP